MKKTTKTTTPRTTKRAAKAAVRSTTTNKPVSASIELATFTKIWRAIPTRGEFQPTALASSVKLPVPTVRKVLRALNVIGRVQSNGRGRDSRYSLATG